MCGTISLQSTLPTCFQVFYIDTIPVQSVYVAGVGSGENAGWSEADICPIQSAPDESSQQASHC